MAMWILPFKDEAPESIRNHEITQAKCKYKIWISFKIQNLGCNIREELAVQMAIIITEQENTRGPMQTNFYTWRRIELEGDLSFFTGL